MKRSRFIIGKCVTVDSITQVYVKRNNKMESLLFDSLKGG